MPSLEKSGNVRRMNGEWAVRLEGVRKNFGETQALKGISAAVPRGSICGVIGPNGSGKTTSLRIILDMIQPDEGRVELFDGQPPGLANNRISYLPEERGLYRKMRVRHQLAYLAMLKGVERGAIREKIAYWLDRMGLPEAVSMKVEMLSKGMAQKIQFIGTLINDPDLLILDEPFSGLDPVNLDLIREIVLERKRAGATILFSTHDMSMAEELCDTLIMIYRGNKVLDGNLESIQRRYGADTVRLRARPDLALHDWEEILRADGAKAELQAPPDRDPGENGRAAMRDLGRVREFRGLRDPQGFLGRVQGRTAVEYFEVKPPSLHDIFVRVVREEVAP